MAATWNKLGDHPAVTQLTRHGAPEKGIGKLETDERSYEVHPGDIIIEVDDELHPVHPAVYELLTKGT